MLKIVAFLQNPWFPPSVAARHVEMYRTNRDFRLRVLCLSVTGKRLLKAFGFELMKEIEWEEADPVAGCVSNHRGKANLDHMRQVIAHHDPGLVLAFGSLARDAVPKVWQGPFLYTQHPTARDRSKCERLEDFAARVRRTLSVQPPIKLCTFSLDPVSQS